MNAGGILSNAVHPSHSSDEGSGRVAPHGPSPNETMGSRSRRKRPYLRLPQMTLGERMTAEGKSYLPLILAIVVAFCGGIQCGAVALSQEIADPAPMTFTFSIYDGERLDKA